MKIFSLIEKKPTISNETIIESLGRKTSSKQLNSLKTHLLKNLLASLRDYHRKNSINIEHRADLDRIQVLRLKGQLKWAAKESKRLLDRCEKIEAFTTAYQALEQLEAIHISLGGSDEKADQNWTRLYSQKQECLKHLTLIDKMRAIERNLVQLTIKFGVSDNGLLSDETSKQLDIIESELQALNVGESASFDAQFRYFQTQAAIGRIRFDHKSELQNFQAVIDLLDCNPHITARFYQDFYAVALHNLINASMFAKSFTLVPNLLEKLEEQQSEKDEIRLRNLHYLVHDKLVFLRLTRKIEGGIDYWKSIENKWKKSPTFNSAERSDITLNAAVLFFWSKDFKETRRLLKPLLENRDETDENLNTARVLSLLLAYEVEDFDYLEHLLRSYNRAWKEDSGANKLELLLLSEFQRNVSRPDSIDWSRIAQKLRATISDPTENNKLFRFDLLYYLETKTQLST